MCALDTHPTLKPRLYSSSMMSLYPMMFLLLSSRRSSFSSSVNGAGSLVGDLSYNGNIRSRQRLTDPGPLIPTSWVSCVVNAGTGIPSGFCSGVLCARGLGFAVQVS